MGRELSSGDVLPGGFRLVRPLGVGGFSLVWAAEQVSTGQVYAVKIAKRNSYLPTLRRQARTPVHDHIVKVHSLQDSEQPFYLVLEHVDGANLRLVLQRYPNGVSLPALVRVFRQIVEAVGAAHRAGVVHGDLKPENVLVSQDRVVKVSDFGVLQSGGELAVQHSLSTTQDAKAAYTPLYLAPEFRGSAERLSAATDLYALGIILHELATGRPPFGADLPSALRPDLPEAVDQLFSRLCTHPSRRVRSVDEVAELVAKLESGAAGTVASQQAAGNGRGPEQSASEAAPVSRASGRHGKRPKWPRVRAAIAGAVLVASVVVGLFVLRSSRHTPAEAVSVATAPAPSRDAATNGARLKKDGTDWGALMDEFEAQDAPTSAPKKVGSVRETALAAGEAEAESERSRIAPSRARRPRLLQTSPTDGAVVAAHKIEVTGRIEGAGVDRVYVDGYRASLDLATGRFRRSTELKEGRNEIVIELGTAVRETRVFFADTTPPVLRFEMPESDTTTRAKSVLLRGAVDEAHVLAVTVNGAAVPVDKTGAFARRVELVKEGRNTFTVVARDHAAHEATAVWTVTRDTTPPSVTIVVPPYVVSPTVPVRVSVNETVKAVEVNGVTASRSGESWAAVAALGGPLTEIRVRAADRAGNLGEGKAVVQRMFLAVDAVDGQANSVNIRVLGRDKATGRWTVAGPIAVKEGERFDSRSAGVQSSTPGLYIALTVKDVKHRRGVDGKDEISATILDAVSSQSFRVASDARSPLVARVLAADAEAKRAERRRLARESVARRRHQQAVGSAKRRVRSLSRKYEKLAAELQKSTSQVSAAEDTVNAYRASLPSLEAAERGRVAEVRRQIGDCDQALAALRARLAAARTVRPPNWELVSYLNNAITEQTTLRTRLQRESTYRDPSLPLRQALVTLAKMRSRRDAKAKKVSEAASALGRARRELERLSGGP